MRINQLKDFLFLNKRGCGWQYVGRNRLLFEHLPIETVIVLQIKLINFCKLHFRIVT